ncbi:MAG: HAD family phosphatase [Alphaproteobacteria bacterium]|nr:HAD family phosphatase [Alphaproteobacteria bacterium]
MLVIFDCDGVLIDSEVIYSAVDAAMLTTLGHPTAPAELSRRFTGVPHRDVWRILAAELGFAPPDDLFPQIEAECRRRFAEELAAIPGAADTVRTAAALGHATCVASSTGLSGLRANLASAGLLDLFGDAVFSASQVRRGKPAPDVFLYAASQMGADPADCLVIEDSVAGATGARRAGMAVVGFTGGSHADAELADRLRAAGAGHVKGAMAELAAWLATLGRG